MIGVQDEAWAQGARGTWTEDDPSVKEAVPLPGFQASKIVPTSANEQAVYSDMSILVVDDDPNICLILSTAIKTIGCQVLTANHGGEGIDKALRLRPNLIISDLLMPRMDGSQFFTKLQEYPETKSIPFVCLTSRGQEEEKLAALQKGVEDYWVKPFSIGEITLRIKKLLNRQIQALQSEYVSSVAGQVELAGNLAEMTPADLLRFMEVKQKTGALHLKNGEADGFIVFQDGMVTDAQYANLVGEPALFTMLNWSSGSFMFQSQPVSSPRTIIASTDEILARMMQRYDEEYYLIEQLPPVDTTLVLSPKFDEALRTVNFPRSVERLMILFDGRNNIGECLEQLRGDTEAIRLLVDFYRQGLAVVHTRPVMR
jgi:DNA-binding response OmpR family regulator